MSMPDIEQFKKAYAIVVKDAFKAYIGDRPYADAYLEAATFLDFAIQTELEFIDEI